MRARHLLGVALLLVLVAIPVLAGSGPGWLPFSRSSGGGGGLSSGAADAAYLRLDATNDPLTGGLSVNAGTAATDASVTTPTGKDLWLSAGGGAGSRALRILSSTSSSVGDGVELHGSAAALAGRTSILLSTDVGTHADRYPVRITRTGSIDVWKVNGLGQSLAADGTANNPSMAFASDPDSGLYWGSANLVYMAAGGLRSQAWQNGTQTFYASDGTTPQLTVSATAITSTRPYVAPTGTVGAPAFATTGDLDSGFYGDGSGSLFVTTDNSWAWSWGPTVVESGRPLALLAGAAATPSLSASGDTTTGLYWPAASTLAVSTGGALAWSWDTAAATSGLDIVPNAAGKYLGSDTTPWGFLLLDDGTAAAPSIAFAQAGSNDTGFYQPGVDQVGIAANGAAALTITSAAIQPYHSIVDTAFSSTAANPLIEFDGDTGIYDSGVDEMGFSAAGVGQWEITGAGFIPIADNSETIGSSSLLASNVYTYGVTGPVTGALSLVDDTEVSLVVNGQANWKAQNDNLFARQWTSGTMGGMRVPTGIANTLPTKPTCTGSSHAGTIIYVDDSNDAAAGELCVCRAASDNTTYSWVKVADNSSACI